MTSFWLTKKTLLEALKMSEGLPQDTMIMFKGDSERKDNVTYTITEINVGTKKKTLKQVFKGEEL